MSLTDKVERMKYTLQVVKKVEQRPEHIASVLYWSPKVYKFKFITIHKFEEIPEHFIDIYRVILFKGAQVDGTPQGLYELVLHGRGKKYGQTNPERAKWLGGATISYDSKGLQVKRIQVRIPVFLKLLRTIKDVNSILKGDRN
jgi:hypothetical protein